MRVCILPAKGEPMKSGKEKTMDTVWDMPETEGGGVFRNINRVNCHNVD